MSSPRLAVALGALAALLSTAAHAQSPAPSPEAVPLQPDIIVVMVDDLAYLEDDAILKRLPNIRRLFLEEGLRFTRAFNEVPLCCPARANFHGGQHSLRNGVTANHPRRFDHTRTLATALDDAGYRTQLLGKYLNNYDGSVVPPGWDQVSIDRNYHRRRPEQWIDGRVRTSRGFFDDVLRRRAVKWMSEAPRSAPVFQFLSPRAPHFHPNRCAPNARAACRLTPAVMVRDQDATACRGIGRFRPASYTTSTKDDPFPVRVPRGWRWGWPLKRFCESLLVVDRMVGQVDKAQHERERPAYWLFLSDNGMAWGRHGFPLKAAPWSTQLPFYVHGPRVEAGSTAAGISIIDIPVTIAELAGVSMPWADGIAFTSVLDGSATEHRTEVLEHMPASPPNSPLLYRAWQGLRTGPWRYIRWDAAPRELYDLVADPEETRNLAATQPDTVMELDARLDELIEASRG